MTRTKVVWINRLGERREHTLFDVPTEFYARAWWYDSILACQGVLSVDERRASKLKLLDIQTVHGNILNKSKNDHP